MVRKAYYLRRQKYNNARECTEDLYKKERCIVPPKKIIAFERGNAELDDISTKGLANLFGISAENLLEEDGKDWRMLNVVHGK